MDMKAAQLDLDHAFYGGAPGAMVSGVVWMLAGAIGAWLSPQYSIAVLFIGGMLIYPLGMLISRMLGRPGSAANDNPLTALAMESTVLLFLGLFVAWICFSVRIDWFYPIMLLTIGGRYLIFQTLYGNKLYWLLGASLIAAGTAGFLFALPFYVPALTGGGLELLFAAIIFFGNRGHR
ncbi:hypothetical protein CLV84_2644 [Neolewinella xylanilytica]|uniref:Uncharacterized protein n=1 Tax=Neolewinella xylanilytica TaxID=1514080 RepID=A0A2S6I3K5_9BACT|nr:hypothetical protein [Neolewinella xylanilytica]PPK85740.1 hypothetical protein CLV84_2644 [Neolewinella xylanilytica]